MFLHGSWIHILFNSLSIVTFCLGVENSWGLLRYLIVYFSTGIIGGLFSSMWSSNKISVGASCAIFGVMGAYCALVIILWSQLDKMQKVSLTFWLIMFPVMFVCVSFLPNVDYAGHLGGVLGGLSVGFIIFWQKAEEKYRRWFLIIGIILVVLSLAIPLIVIYTR
jgi:rhomboid protease GluP